MTKIIIDFLSQIFIRKKYNHVINKNLINQELWFLKKEAWCDVHFFFSSLLRQDSRTTNTSSHKNRLLNRNKHNTSLKTNFIWAFVVVITNITNVKLIAKIHLNYIMSQDFVSYSLVETRLQSAGPKIWTNKMENWCIDCRKKY